MRNEVESAPESVPDLRRNGRKLRVLLLAHSVSRTGSPLVALTLFRHLQNEVELFTVALDGGDLQSQFAQLGPILVLADAPRALRHLPRGASLRWNGLRARQQMRKYFGAPDLVYVNSVIGLHCARYIETTGAPAILHVHEMEHGQQFYPPQNPSLFFQWPQKYIAVSQATKDDLVATGIEAEKIEIVHEFIEPQFAAKQSDFSRTTDFVVGGSGQVNWRKGVDLWLLMAFYLRQILSSVRFVWVGVDEGEEAKLFRLKARRMGLNESVEFVTTTDKPQEHFARFDVFAMTSWEDPCPLVVLENMLLETPVACFAPGGGAQEEVGDTGIIIEDFDPHQMAQQIASLLQDESRLKALGENARHRVLERFTSDVQVPKIRQIMARVLS